jgi:DNA-binding response OmpR family regulator
MGLSNTAAPGARAPILVVEDDPSLRQVVRSALEARGLQVDAVGDGRQAIRCAAHNRPEFVLLDLSRPALGEATATSLRVLYGEEMPIVMAAAGPSTGVADWCRGLAYVRKPFAVDDLLDAVACAGAQRGSEHRAAPGGTAR